MCNQMVTSEIGNNFTRPNPYNFPSLYEYTIWLPINIIGDELR